MAAVIVLTLLNYFIGWCVLASANDDLFRLYNLLKQEESPENSQDIRETASRAFSRKYLVMFFGGLIGWAMVWLFTAVPSFVRQTAELKRRYGKAKRGYGIKPDNEEAETEAESASLDASYQAKAYRNSR